MSGGRYSTGLRFGRIGCYLPRRLTHYILQPLGTMPSIRDLTLSVATGLVILTSVGQAQQRSAALPPVADVAAGVPTPAEVLGYELGEDFTCYTRILQYLNEVAEASPRVSLQRYGRSAEGRYLVQVLVAREDYKDRMDEILHLNRELADPATTPARADSIASVNPAVVYFSYGVHGSETSSSEAALWDIWDLAADAPGVTGVLDSVVVVIDPNGNPDGRERYINWYRQARGMEPDPNPDAWEHFEPWPGSRVNHYFFDLNRDWAWMTQVETRARIATWSRWTPQVHVDFHEMGYTSDYFFFPATEPINPLYPQFVLDWGRYFGESNARAFDEKGLHYFTAETFDLFYPAYGDSWPSLVGSIGMTYEQGGGSRAGLAIQRPDGTVLTLKDRAEGHRTAAAATLRATAARKGQLLREFAETHRTAGQDFPDILILPGDDDAPVHALLELLRGQEIRVEEAGRAFEANSRSYPGFEERREFPGGTLRVPARQARGRLALTLLLPEIELDADFSYDISAWSLPYAFGLEAHLADVLPDADWQVLSQGAPWAMLTSGEGALEANEPDHSGSPAPAKAGEEPYGYLVAPGFGAWPAMIRFLDAGGTARVLEKEFELDGRSWPAGTFFLPSLGNPDLVDLVDGAGLGPRAVVVQTGLATRGRDLGTRNAHRLESRRIALLTGEGVAATSVGAHRFFLEQTVQLPFSAVPLSRVGSMDLDEYDVLIVPELSGRWRDHLTSSRLEDISDWVRRGGVVVAVGRGARSLADPLADIETRRRETDDEDRLDRALRGREQRRLDRWEDQVPGTVFPVRLDPDHPLSFGVESGAGAETLFVLHRGRVVFEPDGAFESVAYFPEELEQISGVASPSSLEHLSRGTWLADRRLGSGRVILFIDDPLFRHLWYSKFQLYVNALLLGPSY